jgi:TolB-like protein
MANLCRVKSKPDFMKNIIATITLFFSLLTTAVCHAQDQPKPTIAVLGIDCKTSQEQDSESITYMVRLELEKTGVYTVMDRYEIAEVVKKNGLDINGCFSKSCLVEAGKALHVDKMLGGSIDLMGAKLVITLRLVDVATGNIEKSNATEYLNLPELQKMIRISVLKTIGLEPDPVMTGQLVDYDVPIASPRNAFKLNGPRMGFAYMTGDAATTLTAPESKGGFNMYAAQFQFGWQQEVQYISAGNFHALIENVFMVSGLESGRAIPSYTPLLGFRFGKNAWEFAFGPTFRLVQKADGFYDVNGLIGTAGDWHLKDDWFRNSSNPFPNNYDIVTRLDSRGYLTVSTGLVIAAGRTFHSGYLNIPVNAYVAPHREGTSMGLTFGFNIQKKDRAQKRGDIYIKAKTTTRR